MDRKDNFLKKLEEFIEIVDTEYLIGISNKGIVNRSSKDLDKALRIEYQLKEDGVEFKIDDITCTVTDEVQKYKCSCPSRSICKHVIMCYLYLMANKAQIFENTDISTVEATSENNKINNEGLEDKNKSQAEEDKNKLQTDEDKNKSRANRALLDRNTAQTKEAIEGKNKAQTPEKNHKPQAIESNKEKLNQERFSKLKEFPIEFIKKEIGEKVFETLIRRIEFGINATINEGSLIVIDFNEENIVVKLLDNIENSICSCKSKELCRHKAEALILYKLKSGCLTLDQLKSYEASTQYLEIDNIKSAAIKIRTCIEDILISGLSRTPLTILDTLNNMAIICHNYDLPNFEKSLRDMREEFSLYLNKNASFKNERLLSKLTSLYTKTIALENTKDLNKLTLLVGEFKSSYYEVPPLELYGLGAEKWKSKSGYEGTTFYFLENKRKEIVTYTNAIPTYYDNTNKYKKNFNAEAPWELNCKIDELSNIHFKLIHGKLNSQNRISSSNESKGTIIGNSSLNDINIEKFTYDNWNTLIEKIFIDGKLNNQDSNLVFLKICKFGDNTFDNISQTLKVPIYDKEDNTIQIVVNFSGNTKSMIKRIERIVKYKKKYSSLGRIYINEGKVNFFPITFYSTTGEGENLTL